MRGILWRAAPCVCGFGIFGAKSKTYALSCAENEFQIEEVTISSLHKAFEQRQISSRRVTEIYLNRIRELDKNGPKLNSIIEINPEALDIADAKDEERRNGLARGALHGIPVLIKDNIDTSDHMMTTAGSAALEGNMAKKDAFIVAKLRDSGAIILGKTNMSEWANFRSTNSTSGWSSRGGQTKCPYVLNRNPSGSSSGAGTAAAANLCTVSIGTETNGSIISPSAINGLVGIKPTVGLWSRSGIIPISATQDTAGPMARTVSDAVALLGPLAGEDPEDPATVGVKGQVKSDYTQYLDVNGLRGKRIGVEKSALRMHPAIDPIFQEALHCLRAQGATLVEVDFVAQLQQDTDEAEMTVLLYEFKDGLNKYLETAQPPHVKSLREVIAFNKAHEAKAMPYFKQERLELAEATAGLDSPEYVQAVARVTDSARGAIDRVLREHALSAIVAPSNGLAVCIDLVNGDYDNGFSFWGPAAMAGYPHITVPMGAHRGLPVGLSFVGARFDEGALIPLAYAYEQASNKRSVPTFQNDLL